MAENTDAALNRWKDRWGKKFAPWHLTFPHPVLVSSKDIFLGPQNVRVLVPFCGKAVDMKWLYEQGHEVVGVEGSAVAIEEFFEESGIEYILNEDGVTYQTLDKKLTVICGNFFTIAGHYVHSFDCVWDRAALSALPEDNRKFFAEAIKRLVKSKFRYAIVTFEYEQAKVAGPPFSLSSEDIATLYKDWAKMSLLCAHELPSYTDQRIVEKFRQANVSVKEKAYLLKHL